MTDQSQNNIKVTLRLLDRQLAPRRHHRELIDHLRHHLESLQAHQCESNIRDSLTASCQHYLQQLPSQQDDRVADHRTLGDSSSSSSSTSSSDLQHQLHHLPHLHIGVITLEKGHQGEEEENGHQREQSSLDNYLGHPRHPVQHHRPPPRQRIVYDIGGDRVTSHIEYIMDEEEEEEEEEHQHQGWQQDAQRWLHHPSGDEGEEEQQEE